MHICMDGWMYACTSMLVACMARCRSTHCAAHEQQDIAGIHHRLDHAAVPAEIVAPVFYDPEGARLNG